MEQYYKKIREKIGNDLLILPAVAAKISKGNKILLVKKRESKIWAIPAGAVEPNEEIEEFAYFDQNSRPEHMLTCCKEKFTDAFSKINKLILK